VRDDPQPPAAVDSDVDAEPAPSAAQPSEKKP